MPGRPRLMNVRLRHPALSLVTLIAVAAPFACETGAATYAVIDDAYPSPANDGGTGAQNVVYRGWWTVAYFATPVAAGAESDSNRVIPATDPPPGSRPPAWLPPPAA